MAGLSSQELRDLRTVFDVYDPSSTGRIRDMSDLRKCLRVLGFRCSREKIHELMSNLHQPAATIRDGSLDFVEFTQLVSMLQGTDYDNHEEMAEAFSILDAVSGDDQISLEDLKAVSRKAGMRLTEDELKGMIDEADRDGNGLVSRDEFIAVMQRTALFS